MIKRTTGSQISRVEICPGSQGLPHCKETGTAPQEGGNSKHRFLQLIREDIPRARALQYVEDAWGKELASECESINVEVIGDILSDPVYSAEVSLAYGNGQARVIGYGLDRDYSAAKPEEVVLTVDVLGVFGDRIHVVDYKSGHAKLGAARDSAQLLMGALAACRAFGKDKATVEYVYLHDNVWSDSADIDIFDLEDFEERMVRMQKRLKVVESAVKKGRLPDVTAGTHCTYCPAYNACPANKSLALELATGNDAAPFNTALSRPAMADAWEKVQAAKRLLNKITKAIIAEAQREPIQLNSGKMLGQVTKKGNEKLSGDTVFEVIAELYGEEVAADAVNYTATKTGIDAALKKHKVEKTSAAKKQIIEQVRGRGGATKKNTMRVEEY